MSIFTIFCYVLAFLVCCLNIAEIMLTGDYDRNIGKKLASYAFIILVFVALGYFS